jgi:transposase InsO family protein
MVGGAAVPSEQQTLWEGLERVRQQAIQLHQRSENLRRVWGLEDERRARIRAPTSHGPDGDPAVPGWGGREVARLGPRMAASAVAAAEAACALRRCDQARHASPTANEWAARDTVSVAARRARDTARFAEIVQDFASFVANPAIQQIMVESVSESNGWAASSGSQERQ